MSWVDLLNKVKAAQQSGAGIPIPQILSPDEQAFMASVWPQVRSAADFSHINWSAHGYPSGPPLAAPSYAAMQWVWPRVHVAADFSHPNWNAVPVPYDIIGAAMPVPEAPASTPPPAVPTPTAPPVTTGPISTGGGGGGGGGYYQPISYQPMEDALEEGSGQPVPVSKAGLFGSFSMPVVLTAAGVILFFSMARGAMGMKPARRRRRR